MRELTGHKVNGCNENLNVIACDEPGSGGACHHYQIVNVSKQNTGPDADWVEADICFQNGPVAEVGTNGVTHEALLAILEDRLAAFQAGAFECFENEKALYHVREAMMWLKHRTERRIARGVEGTLAE